MDFFSLPFLFFPLSVDMKQDLVGSHCSITPSPHLPCRASSSAATFTTPLPPPPARAQRLVRQCNEVCKQYYTNSVPSGGQIKLPWTMNESNWECATMCHNDREGEYFRHVGKWLVALLSHKMLQRTTKMQGGTHKRKLNWCRDIC